MSGKCLTFKTHMLLLLITLWQSNYNEAMKYKLKVQNEILTISLAKGLCNISPDIYIYIYSTIVYH